MPSSGNFAFPPPESVAVPVHGSEQSYPVRRIFCVGRNYADHAREMGGDPQREPPFYFAKSPAHLMLSGGTLHYPPGTQDLQHEVELVVALGAPAWRATTEQARTSVWAYGCGLDMTRRDLQAVAKKAGRAWTFAKDFEGGAVLGALSRAGDIGHLGAGAITLDVNGQRRQQGKLSQMLWTVPEVVARLSEHYHLGPGDLIFTGTPAGVGPVQVGDHLDARIEGLQDLELYIGPPA